MPLRFAGMKTALDYFQSCHVTRDGPLLLAFGSYGVFLVAGFPGLKDPANTFDTPPVDTEVAVPGSSSGAHLYQVLGGHQQEFQVVHEPEYEAARLGMQVSTLLADQRDALLGQHGISEPLHGPCGGIAKAEGRDVLRCAFSQAGDAVGLFRARGQLCGNGSCHERE